MSEFGQLVTKEIPALRRFSLKLTCDPIEAEDLVQSCLLRALIKEDLWQPGTDLRCWLFTILYNQRVSGLRRQARERNHLGDAARALALPTPSDPSCRLLAGEIARAIVILPIEQREVFRRIVLGGMDYAEAAVALAIPEGTIRSRLFRARDKLRKLVDQDADAGKQVPFSARPPAKGERSDEVAAGTGLATGPSRRSEHAAFLHRVPLSGHAIAPLGAGRPAFDPDGSREKPRLRAGGLHNKTAPARHRRRTGCDRRSSRTARIS